MLELEPFLTDTREKPPCGPNLEHDLAFFELEEAARGKAEQQIGDAVKPGEDPQWQKVVDLGQSLLLRSKDLRVAVLLTRALTRTEGIVGLTGGVRLIHAFLNQYWDQVHPQLEADAGDDPTERLSALAPLADPEAMVKDLRDVQLFASREFGQLQARDVEIALGRLARPAGANPVVPLDQLQRQIARAFGEDRTVPVALREAREQVLAIQNLVTERVGSGRAVDFKPLLQPMETLLEVCEAALGVASDVATVAETAAEVRTGAGVAVIGSEIRSREDALRVLDMVCNYLERHEPSNPAPLFIRRAQRLMRKDFVEIVKDLLPDSISRLDLLAGGLENPSA